MDINNPESKKQIVTFLPRSVTLIEKENSEIDCVKKKLSLPLCFQAFFEWYFFTQKELQGVILYALYEINKLTEKQIISIDSVNQLLKWFNTYGTFQWRPEVLAKLILSYRGKMTYWALTKYILWVKSEWVVEEFYKKHPEISGDVEFETLYEEDQKLLLIYQENIKKYNKILIHGYMHTNEHEKKTSGAHGHCLFTFHLLNALSIHIHMLYISMCPYWYIVALFQTWIAMALVSN